MIVEPGITLHPKFTRLKKAVGVGALEYLINLWGYCQQRRTDELGRAEYVEEIARWDGSEGVLFSALEKFGWIDVENGWVWAHGWSENNQAWLSRIAGGKKRGEQQKKARKNEENTAQTALILPADRQLSTVVQLAAQPTQLAASVEQVEQEEQVEKHTPLSSPKTEPKTAAKNTKASIDETVQFICGFFDRRTGVLSGSGMHALRSISDALPLADSQTTPLRLIFASRKKIKGEPEDFTLRHKWLTNAEALAENLLAAVDIATQWCRDNGLTSAAEKIREKKKEGPEPEGWREWLTATYPTALVPPTFVDLDSAVRDEFEREKSGGKQA